VNPKIATLEKEHKNRLSKNEHRTFSFKVPTAIVTVSFANLTFEEEERVDCAGHPIRLIDLSHSVGMA
jgi:hypothetical protein